MQFIIRILGGALQRALKISRTESLSATANVFVGQTEAPLVVRPYIANMTRSELFAVMVGGLASVAGSVLAGYASLGIELKYLVAASFMAAPGGLLMAKLIIPETKTPSEKSDGTDQDSKPANVIDAAASGAASGLQLALNVGAMLLAFIGLIALLNGMVGWVAALVGFDGVTIQQLLGYAFAPLAFLIGVPWHEAIQAGSFIGQKLIVNEFVAYIDFVNVKDSLSAHTQAIITFALCGFANLSSIAILLGGLGAMAPTRRTELAQLGMKAVLAGSLSNLMSATLAGLFLAL
jgi:CNT family concentrative nucleoside transporter